MRCGTWASRSMSPTGWTGRGSGWRGAGGAPGGAGGLPGWARIWQGWGAAGGVSAPPPGARVLAGGCRESGWAGLNHRRRGLPRRGALALVEDAGAIAEASGAQGIMRMVEEARTQLWATVDPPA